MFRTDRSRLARALLRSAMVAAVLALSGMAAVQSEAGAASPIGSTPAKFAAAFVNWGPEGREHTLQAWEKWLNQTPSTVIGVDFYGKTTWQDFSELSWVPGIWKKLNPARNVVWSIPLTVKGTPLADVANGLHDSEFEAAAKAIADAQPKAIIRLGWEMNLVELAVVRQGPGDGLHRGLPARGWNFQAVLRRLQIRLVSGLGAAGTQRRSRLSRRRRGRLHRPRRL